MIKVNNFHQNRLIERIDEILHPPNKARLDEDWSGVFRNSFLQMMPVEDLGKGRAVFASKACKNCPKLKQCIASKHGNNYIISYDAKSLRLRERRLYEQTDEFKDDYRPRGEIEALYTKKCSQDTIFPKTEFWRGRLIIQRANKFKKLYFSACILQKTN